MIRARAARAAILITLLVVALSACRTPSGANDDAGAVAAGGSDAGGPDAGPAVITSDDAGPEVEAGADAGVDGGAPDTTAYTCTQIHGAAQSRSWFIDDLFEGHVGAGRWQRLGGTGINHWRNADDAVWGETLDHPCAVGSDAPDRVVQVVWGHTTFSTDQWEANLRQAMAVTREKYPSVRAIVLQPVAALPDCAGSYASEQNARIVEAIGRVLEDGVRAGPVLALESCADIETLNLDRLTPEASRRVAEAHGRFFAR